MQEMLRMQAEAEEAEAEEGEKVKEKEGDAEEGEEKMEGEAPAEEEEEGEKELSEEEQRLFKKHAAFIGTKAVSCLSIWACTETLRWAWAMSCSAEPAVTNLLHW